ncbi:phosphoribosylpyrophosphate synthetase [Zhengella mangrovi]|uniref:Phosphoribosylpyrophosphate synthetase n=1 Tax=Zhengella mangrovi TaxID=1982044 RepID=A0A2G1QN94_9HYPH|nr:ribose-phosphate pyrophosphokinase [Zhengella mangrovi]PHP66993.1 phosphoribosylpyrophosphate synthetase [Zhengella mangrovi]
MTRLLVALPGNEGFAERLAEETGCAIAPVSWHRFPDGETNLRFQADLAGASIALVATLDRPDGKFLPLAFCAATARDLGASRVGLVAPYLSYMRQDRRFHDGEAVTARYFPTLLGSAVDWLVTADPHLHRIHDLGTIYSIPTHVVHCAAPMGAWIRDKVSVPLIVGPDSESAQWAGAIAEAAGAPHVVLSKTRHGDLDVDIAFPDMSAHAGRVPVLVDDIISSGQSMVRAIKGLRAAGFAEPWCIGVHGIFADGAEDAIRKAGAAGIVSCNTVRHGSNAIDVSGLFAGPVAAMM